MSSFSKEEVKRVADLARIALTEEEIAQFAGELGVISESVAKISAVVSDDIPATSHPIPLTNVWREDEIGAGIDREEVLAGAPDSQDGKFKVPSILGEE
ncbi:Asp-tRNA(Asn)/Glu-tRNA(Gln) amidotransferase subunit GatC [Arcanobacterium hippocoleae]|uniref:Aspartyl/glutamyl-tRNA(Asn/Gln) amidotransferase subunit C n=1 Tax=Arcanobacterium hippocoleae TaxID=149017 RepID=A0ABU1T1G2_9ACTO|nr:Asp-tRNA(Asn)/Glu-tRNA(Gln) amidotransferase subunit GatC [Arcanobacterium hippocoleae]MDR6939205.1 aspartyl-tRNA(Asn)/glutamyl-tRNA(Gln) amidotransferase subunit C [Arcanobacterium hippocoleae]